MSDSLNQGNSGGTPPSPDVTSPIQLGAVVPAPGVPAEAAPAASAPAPAAEAAAPAEGDFRQHYSLLFCSVAMFIGATWLPIEGGVLDLYAKDSISGGFLTVFAAYGICAGWMNIHNRKMIVWPAFFAAADGLYIAVKRGMELVKPALDRTDMAPRDWVRLFGPGYYIITICSLMVLWTLLTAVMDGAKRDAERKEAAKAARGKK